MGGWSVASVSAAERSWDGRRVRKYDADEVVRLAAALGVPVIAMFLAPPDAGTAVDYVFEYGADRADGHAGLLELLTHIAPPYEAGETPAAAAFRERIIALGASRYDIDPVAGAVFGEARAAADEVLGRARREADAMLTKAYGHSVQLTTDARTRAESLELDAQNRHRMFMGSLIESRQELERRVDDLRNFEREYRSRLEAYLEGQLRDLRAGVADSGAFPAVGGDPDGNPSIGGGQ
jgi:hypothetical protein